MNASNSNQLVIKEYPVSLWLFGGFAILLGAYFLFIQVTYLPGLISLGIGLVIGVLLPSTVTVIADRQSGILTISQRGLLRRSKEEYPFWDIDSVEVESTRSDEGSSTHRLALVLSSGTRVPLRGYYTSGYGGKEKKARQLREFIGVTGLEAPAATASQAVRQALAVAYHHEEYGVTHGVSWRVEAATFGAAPFTRWLSRDFTLPGGFLFLAQKPAGSQDILARSVLKGLSGLAYKQALKMYGFQPDDTPGLETAQAHELPPRLQEHFSAYTNDPRLASQALDAWVVTYLGQWAERYPMKQIQSRDENSFGQLVVLFSPNGLYLAYFNAHNPELTQSLTDLGVDLVRALVSLPDGNETL